MLYLGLMLSFGPAFRAYRVYGQKTKKTAEIKVSGEESWHRAALQLSESIGDNETAIFLSQAWNMRL